MSCYLSVFLRSTITHITILWLCMMRMDSLWGNTGNHIFLMALDIWKSITSHLETLASKYSNLHLGSAGISGFLRLLVLWCCKGLRYSFSRQPLDQSRVMQRTIHQVTGRGQWLGTQQRIWYQLWRPTALALRLLPTQTLLSMVCNCTLNRTLPLHEN